MRVYGIWFGGTNYNSSYILNKDIEQFSSLQSAKDTFYRRSKFDPYYPCVDDLASMQLCVGTAPDYPENERDNFTEIDPNIIITQGKKGGIITIRSY